MNTQEDRIYNINNTILHNSRKMFGMHGNIQWSVVDIENDNYYIRISSPRSGIDQKQIAKNITESVLRQIPEAKVKTEWVTWKKEHGVGALVSTAGKTVQEITNELYEKLNTEHPEETLEEYLLGHYQRDVDLYRGEAGNSLCHLLAGNFIKNGGLSKLHNPKHFFIVSYELNLLSQIFYSHFKEHHDKWMQLSPDFVECRCYHGSSPLSIIKHLVKTAGDSIKITKDDILNADKLMLQLLEQKLDAIHGVELDEIFEVIKNDPDCNPEQLLVYLNK